MKIFVACSKHFYHKVMPVVRMLEAKGHQVTLPNSFEEPFKEEEMKKLSREHHIGWKRARMREQVKKIRPVDAVLVLNFEKKGIPNYIGGATFMEVIKAWELGKKIFFYNPLPNCSFTDELSAIHPKLIHQNLELVQ